MGLGQYAQIHAGRTHWLHSFFFLLKVLLSSGKTAWGGSAESGFLSQMTILETKEYNPYLFADERTRDVADLLAIIQLVAGHCKSFSECSTASSWTSGISVWIICLLCQNSQSFISPLELQLPDYNKCVHLE